MREDFIDIFSNYDLPFKTFIATSLDNDETIHKEMELIWVIKGQIDIYCEGEHYILKNNNVFLIFMNRKHTVKTKDNTTILFFRFKQDYLKKHNLNFHKIPFKNHIYTFQELSKKYPQVLFILHGIVKIFLSQNINLLHKYSIIAYYNIYIFNLYTMLIKEFYLDIKTQNYDIYLNRIQAIIDYTEKHYFEPIKLKKLAELTKISTYRLSHFVKDTFGLSYSNFVQQIRLQHALTLLKETNIPITEVAYKAGFKDHKYLSQTITNQFGITPLKYRKMIKKQDKILTINYNTDDLLKIIECIRFDGHV